MKRDVDPPDPGTPNKLSPRIQGSKKRTGSRIRNVLLPAPKLVVAASCEKKPPPPDCEVAVGLKIVLPKTEGCWARPQVVSPPPNVDVAAMCG
jgi:hypothetical protein